MWVEMRRGVSPFHFTGRRGHYSSEFKMATHRVWNATTRASSFRPPASHPFLVAVVKSTCVWAKLGFVLSGTAITSKNAARNVYEVCPRINAVLLSQVIKRVGVVNLASPWSWRGESCLTSWCGEPDPTSWCGEFGYISWCGVSGSQVCKNWGTGNSWTNHVDASGDHHACSLRGQQFVF